jgi:hypothetical protein
MDEDIETWPRTWKDGRGYGDMDDDFETWTGNMETWRHENMES